MQSFPITGVAGAWSLVQEKGNNCPEAPALSINNGSASRLSITLSEMDCISRGSLQCLLVASEQLDLSLAVARYHVRDLYVRTAHGAPSDF